MTHYFSQEPASRHDKRTIQVTIRGHNMHFLTDSGVFSKGGLDYGTRLLLETVVIPPGARVLDLGCGWGPLGVTAALLNPTGQVTLVDINERALDLVAVNAKQNGVANITILQSDGFANLAGHVFDVVLTNPPIRAGKDVVFSFYEGAEKALAPSGSLWVVIQKKQGAQSTEKKLASLFCRVEMRERSKGYHVYEAVRRKEEIG